MKRLSKATRRLSVVGLLAPILALACGDSAARYRGDGTLVDHGPGDAGHRYALDLGPIEVGESRFALAGLPPAEFTLGFEITGPVGECLHETRPIDPRVSLRMENESGEAVIAEDAPLRDWVWSGSVLCDRAFVYRVGQTEQILLATGASSSHRVGAGPAGGWGTRFTPRRSDTYRLAVRVSPSSLEPYRLRLKAETAGWK